MYLTMGSMTIKIHEWHDKTFTYKPVTKKGKELGVLATIDKEKLHLRLSGMKNGYRARHFDGENKILWGR